LCKIIPSSVADANQISRESPVLLGYMRGSIPTRTNPEPLLVIEEIDDVLRLEFSSSAGGCDIAKLHLGNRRFASLASDDSRPTNRE
jgi:hypothetical protein